MIYASMSPVLGSQSADPYCNTVCTELFFSQFLKTLTLNSMDTDNRWINELTIDQIKQAGKLRLPNRDKPTGH